MFRGILVKRGVGSLAANINLKFGGPRRLEPKLKPIFGDPGSLDRRSRSTFGYVTPWARSTADEQ